MAEHTKDETLAFIDAMRRTLEGKVGFKWLVGRLSDITAYIESITAENERLNAYLDSAGSRDDYEAYRAAHSSAPDRSDQGEEG
jgi:hypothetical protein